MPIAWWPREDRYAEIVATAIVSVVIGQVRRIDRDNILRASLWALARAVAALMSRATPTEKVGTAN